MRRGSPSRPSSRPADEPVGEGAVSAVSEDMAAGMWGPSLGRRWAGLPASAGRASALIVAGERRHVIRLWSQKRP